VCIQGAEAVFASAESLADRLREGLGRNAHQVSLASFRGRLGDLSDSDKAANEAALKYGERILSAYNLESGVRIWQTPEALMVGRNYDFLWSITENLRPI
jgi:hypothetical protein